MGSETALQDGTGPVETPDLLKEALPPLASPCNRTACKLPLCYCDATVIPGGLFANQTPQMVITAFDGAVNMHNYDLYRQIFHSERRNPNGKGNAK